MFLLLYRPIRLPAMQVPTKLKKEKELTSHKLAKLYGYGAGEVHIGGCLNDHAKDQEASHGIGDLFTISIGTLCDLLSLGYLSNPLIGIRQPINSSRIKSLWRL